MRLLPAALCATLLVLATAAQAQESFRDRRYCEVITITSGPSGVTMNVYNSVGFGTCPREEWEALDRETIQDELGAGIVIMNGPRVFLMDRNSVMSAIDEIRTFGTITMARVASIIIPPNGFVAGSYQHRSVNRNTEFVFEAGNEIYELVAPTGRVYVMQSYALLVDDTLDRAVLRAMGERLLLPAGWTYRVRTLNEDLVVVDQDGVATVVQDELLNTYQLSDQMGVAFPSGRKLLVKQSRSGIERLRLVAQGPGIAAPTSCDVNGELIIDSIGLHSGMRIILWADRWRPIVKGKPERGCVYRARRSAVKLLRVKTGKAITVIAKEGGLDAGIPLGNKSSSDDPRPVRLEVRHGDVRHCVEFGGAKLSHKLGRKLLAKDAAPATSCPRVDTLD